MKEQTRLELNISSLIWENWTNQQKKKKIKESHITVSIIHFVALISSCQTPSGPAPPPAYLVLDVCVFEHQRQRSDVLLVHTLAASNLDGVFDAFVDLLGGGLPYVGHRAVGKGGQDLQEKRKPLTS